MDKEELIKKEKLEDKEEKEEVDFRLKGIHILAVSGKLGTGKSYITDNLFSKYLSSKKTIYIGFADHLKVDASITYDVDMERFLYKKDSASRKILQQHGTEHYRNKHGKDIWIKILKKWVEVHISRGYERVIITDARFENEIRWILSVGSKVIKLIAPSRNEDRLIQESNGDKDIYNMNKTHSSENELDLISDKDYSAILCNDYEDKDIMEENFISIVKKHSL